MSTICSSVLPTVVHVVVTSAITRASRPPLLQVMYALSGSCGPILDFFGPTLGRTQCMWHVTGSRLLQDQSALIYCKP